MAGAACVENEQRDGDVMAFLGLGVRHSGSRNRIGSAVTTVTMRPDPVGRVPAYLMAVLRSPTSIVPASSIFATTAFSAGVCPVLIAFITVARSVSVAKRSITILTRAVAPALSVLTDAVAVYVSEPPPSPAPRPSEREPRRRAA